MLSVNSSCAQVYQGDTPSARILEHVDLVLAEHDLLVRLGLARDLEAVREGIVLDVSAMFCTPPFSNLASDPKTVCTRAGS